MYATMSSVLIVWINRECMHEIKFLVRAPSGLPTNPMGPRIAWSAGQSLSLRCSAHDT